MQRIQPFFRTSPDTSTYPLKDLFQDYSRNLILTVGAMYFSLHFFVAATWPQLFGWRIWAIGLVLSITFSAALYILPRSLIAAHFFWQAGLIAAITLGIYLLDEPGIACLYMLLPFSATVILHWTGGLVIEVLIVLIVTGLPGLTELEPLTGSFTLVIIMGGVVSIILGWIVMHVITKVVHQSFYDVAQAQKALKEAREHRAKVFELSKQLDQSYHQLEHTNAALIAYWKEANAAKESKSNFVTHVSHELRTPLNLIAGFSEMMLLSPESYGNVPLHGVYRRDVNAIYQSAQHLLALIDDVIDLERIDVGRIALTFDQVNVASLISETVNLLRNYVQAKGLYLQVNVSSSLPALRADRLRIRQVLLNLLTNAARFTIQGGIRIDVTRQDGMVLFQVTDTGQGISDIDLPHIFDEFHSRDQPSSKWHSGSGLGLPISRKLVELHHGDMGVKSTYMHGTTFWFTLPIYLDEAALTHQANLKMQQSQVWPGLSQKTLVVNQDDTPMLSLLRRYLSEYQIIVEADVLKAVTIAENIKATALLVSDAATLVQTVTAIPIIRCRLPTRDEIAASVNAFDVLAKPISQQDLMSALDRLIYPPSKVLIVDNDPEMVRLFRRMIESRMPAPQCIDAYNGAEALDLLQTQNPDLVLLDLMMPKVDGYSVLAQIAANPAWSQIPVIVISGNVHAILATQLPNSIELQRMKGFETGELLQLLECLLNSLTFRSALSSFQEAPAD